MYKTVAERMKITMRREEAEATGKPVYKEYRDVPAGLLGPTACKKIKRPVMEGEAPAAYVLNRNWNGYLPLYDRTDGQKSLFEEVRK